MSACQKCKKATTFAVAFWDVEGDRESDRRNSHGAADRCCQGKRCRVSTVPEPILAVQRAKTLNKPVDPDTLNQCLRSTTATTAAGGRV